MDGTRFNIPNLWFGISVENQRAYDNRMDIFADCWGAAVKFISFEPLIGPIDLKGKDSKSPEWRDISWVIVGGESGKGAREMEDDWLADLSAFCSRNKIAYFYKQSGSVFAKDHGFKHSKGGDLSEYNSPTYLTRREFPGRLFPEYDDCFHNTNPGV